MSGCLDEAETIFHTTQSSMTQGWEARPATPPQTTLKAWSGSGVLGKQPTGGNNGVRLTR
jgi:hypothetical protein